MLLVFLSSRSLTRRVEFSITFHELRRTILGVAELFQYEKRTCKGQARNGKGVQGHRLCYLRVQLQFCKTDSAEPSGDASGWNERLLDLVLC